MSRKITLKNVRVHNLKGVDLELTPGELIVFTGVSGSGKSSLAFDTIYIEGQRRYIESLSAYARRQLGDFPKPDADLISGISPTIAIEQKTSGRNPRSTVGTMTSIYDYLRVLYARIGKAHCPESGEPVTPQSLEHIKAQVLTLKKESKWLLFAPYARDKKGTFYDEFQELLRKGFTKARFDGKMVDLNETIQVDGKVNHDLDILVDRLVIKGENEKRITDSLSSALEIGNGVIMLQSMDDEHEEDLLFSQHAFSVKSGKSYSPLEPQLFSFNHPAGMCPQCRGMGLVREFDIEKIIDKKKSIADDTCSVASSYRTKRHRNIYDNLAKIEKFKIDTPWEKLPEDAKNLFLYGNNLKYTKMQFTDPEKGKKWIEYVAWRGVLGEAHKKYSEAKSESYRKTLEKLMIEETCRACGGDKIAPYAAAATIGKMGIGALTRLPIAKSYDFLKNLKLTAHEQLIGEELLKEIIERLRFLLDVGLDYLTLDRTSPTLSGGEAQRVRLASQIGSGLVGAIYVLDEPSIGLHPRDNIRLIKTLETLRDKGNTVIVVEHDEETIAAADYVVDVGPFAGALGGEIVAQGTIDDILACDKSITGRFLARKEEIEIPKKRRKPSKKEIVIEGATHHNLKNVTAKFPIGTLIAVTGVSGSGKSSLISEILVPALAAHHHLSEQPIGKHKAISGVDLVDKMVAIDQSPIGRTPRSNPATYCDVAGPIRDLFSELPESKSRGFTPGHFSFNVKIGSCPHCSGMGMKKLDLDFMNDDEWEVCDFCGGARFDSLTLSALYKGKNIHDVLEMTISEAALFFENQPAIKKRLDTLLDVGLGYIKLGQPSPTLSGGEAQRIKLAKELSRPATGKTFYVLDEPTTGLHFYDIRKLVAILQKLVDRGNTVLVIEHNMDLVKVADHLIDLGPEGGEGGGMIIATGTPEQIAALDTPTGRAVNLALNPPLISAKKQEAMRQPPATHISIRKATQNNLKGFDVKIPRDKITVCTGPSGSGKSSLAIETIYAEGQRRYIESMPPYTRQFVKQMAKPRVESIDGLSPAIAIEQKQHAGNPRSTIGTMTEGYDFLRIIYAYLGTAHCPETGEKLETIGVDYVASELMKLPEKSKVQILAPITLKKSETFELLKERLLREGRSRIRFDKSYYKLDDEENDIPYQRGRKSQIELVIDRVVISAESKKRLLDGVTEATKISGGTLIVDNNGEDLFFNLAFSAPSTGKSYPNITPHTFSFNTEKGMCLDCLGLGFQYGADLLSHPETLKMSPIELLHALWGDNFGYESAHLVSMMLEEQGVTPRWAINKMSPEQRQIFFNGSDKPLKEKGQRLTFRWRGINDVLAKSAKSAITEIRSGLIPLMHEAKCPSCAGSRLNPLARSVKLNGMTLPEFCALPLDKASDFFEKLKIPKEKEHLLKEAIEQLKLRLKFINKIGLHYLSLDRSARTLSNGESQRIQLARQLGTGLTGCLYILDEPTVGLHPHNNALLNQCLHELKDLGNTLLLVEHDPLTIEASDYLIDFGPGSGKFGGEIIAQGTPEEIRNNPDSLTGLYLSGKQTTLRRAKPRSFTETIRIENASLHNLKNVTLEIPLGIFTTITGVSGSGKSTLIHDLLQPAIATKVRQKKKKLQQVDIEGATISGIGGVTGVITLNQDPIGQTIRANIASYSDLLTPLRHLFADLKEARALGLQPKHFSPNHPSGMCGSCLGLGERSIELLFLPPVKVVCDACKGFKLNPKTLLVSYKGLHLGNILKMNPLEARDFFSSFPTITKILDTLIAVGLDYLQLDLPMASLSGGEQQRIRLSRELAKSPRGKVVYLLDEPTNGLHSADIAKILPIFHTLVENGHTVIVIEHNLDLIANSDYLIDLGPDAGEYGGKVVAKGTPSQLAKSTKSYTGKYLAEYLKR